METDAMKLFVDVTAISLPAFACDKKNLSTARIRTHNLRSNEAISVARTFEDHTSAACENEVEMALHLVHLLSYGTRLR